MANKSNAWDGMQPKRKLTDAAPGAGLDISPKPKKKRWTETLAEREEDRAAARAEGASPQHLAAGFGQVSAVKWQIDDSMESEEGPYPDPADIAPDLDSLTYDFVNYSSGQLMRQELAKVVHSSLGVYAMVSFLYRDWGLKARAWLNPKIALLRYRKVDGQWQRTDIIRLGPLQIKWFSSIVDYYTKVLRDNGLEPATDSQLGKRTENMLWGLLLECVTGEENKALQEITYSHYALRGRSEDFSLCPLCSRYSPEDLTKQCEKAIEVASLQVCGILAPVFECTSFLPGQSLLTKIREARRSHKGRIKKGVD